MRIAALHSGWINGPTFGFQQVISGSPSRSLFRWLWGFAVTAWPPQAAFVFSFEPLRLLAGGSWRLPSGPAVAGVMSPALGHAGPSTRWGDSGRSSVLSSPSQPSRPQLKVGRRVPQIAHLSLVPRELTAPSEGKSRDWLVKNAWDWPRSSTWTTSARRSQKVPAVTLVTVIHRNSLVPGLRQQVLVI